MLYCTEGLICLETRSGEATGCVALKPGVLIIKIPYPPPTAALILINHHSL